MKFSASVVLAAFAATQAAATLPATPNPADVVSAVHDAATAVADTLEKGLKFAIFGANTATQQAAGDLDQALNGAKLVADAFVNAWYQGIGDAISLGKNSTDALGWGLDEATDAARKAIAGIGA